MARNQRFYTRERKHNPNRVESGKDQADVQRAKGRWENEATRQVRSSHLGYDCYATGKITGEAGKIRCLVKTTRLPSHITSDIQSILPVEMWWPERDHKAAHAMIDAILTFDLKSLASWKSLWPAHEFGFESYMQMAERHLTQLHAKTLDSVRESSKLIEDKREDPGVQVHLPKPALFPYKIVALEPAGRTDLGTHHVILGIARFEDGNAALRVTVRSPPLTDEDRGLLLSRAYVDLMDGRYEVIEHYPGRYHALGLPPSTLLGVLGIKRKMGAAYRRSTPRRPQSGKEPVLDRARRVTAAITSGDPNANPPAEVVAVEDAPPDIDVTRFPDAPRAVAP
jgi:hypothetical protein